ncbi:MAG: hypothetical protein LAT84_07335 [Balneolia bacterium]|nr:hypothetical protein [Balneolia bacterium]
MSKRQDHIDEFGIDLQNEPVHEFSDEEKELFNHFFDEFIVINQKIKDVISDVLENHKDQLFSAQKQRKAEDGYHFLAKPEISYYTK